MRARLATILALSAAILAVAAASAQAWNNWATKHGIQSGESVYGPRVQLLENLVEPQGSGIICAGIRGYGLSCPPVAEDVIFSAGGLVTSEPYAHDHSTFQSGFSAWWQT
jgi:hypothetical protein